VLAVFAVGASNTGSLAVATVLSGWTISVGLPFAAGRALTGREDSHAATEGRRAAELEREQEVKRQPGSKRGERNRGGAGSCTT